MRKGLLGVGVVLVGLLALVPAGSSVGAADPVVAVAGDIACPPGSAVTATRCQQAATASLLAPYDAVLPDGDTQYDCGALSDFTAAYDPTWGDYRGVSHPAVGDNEYSGSTCSTPGASGYFTYFGALASPDQPTCRSACRGYYSYDLGAWHVVALNSECQRSSVGGCAAGDPMGSWLKADLAAHPTACSLVYMHKPYWGNGSVASRYAALVRILYQAHVDVLVTAHTHIYARYAPQDPSGAADPGHGVREFVVGTGGRNHGALASSPLPNLQASDASTFGVLALTLHPTGYDWSFVPTTAKGFTDAGSSACH